MRVKRAALTGFIAFHLFTILCWAVPSESPLANACRSFVRPYVLWAGLFQKWQMFAPNPMRLDNFVLATVTFRDGSSTVWPFPRMENLGLIQRYEKERYRKYAELLRLDTNSRI